MSLYVAILLLLLSVSAIFAVCTRLHKKNDELKKEVSFKDEMAHGGE
jgi:hypothetical protein